VLLDLVMNAGSAFSARHELGYGRAIPEKHLSGVGVIGLFQRLTWGLIVV
jgi:hypothetical protein